MAKDILRAGIDTNVLVAYFKNETNVNGVNRVASGENLFRKAAKGELLIIVSSLVVFEVAEGLDSIDQDFSDLYDLRRWEGFEIVMVNYEIATLGGKIMRKYDLRRKYKIDALLLSTAAYAKAEKFYTWDNRFIRKIKNSTFEDDYHIQVENPPPVRDLFSER